MFGSHKKERTGPTRDQQVEEKVEFGSHKKERTEPTELKTSSNTYTPNHNDIRIVVGEDVLIITDDKQIGGLWAGVGNYDPCSGSYQECFDAMKKLINENFNEACDSLIFKLKEHLYLVNITDGQNRSASSGMSPEDLHLCEDKIDVFYPIINHFVCEHSFDHKIGFVNIFGGGTSIGLAHLCSKLKADGFECYTEGAVLHIPFLKRRNEYVLARYHDYVLIHNYEEFDTSSCIGQRNESIKDFFDNEVNLLIKAMCDRVKERMTQSSIANL